ncbi:LysR family transcriptional regulator [Vibrio sp.]|uniref:LysR family transcriptional regulator n=1 Tax=Vibrio sp. TaxID=678 RepID=UPI003D1463FE
MYSIEQLEAFCTTADNGSFSAAARHLRKAQSVISQHIINLEIDAGMELFDRRGRYPVLTPAGERLLPFARATLTQHQRMSFTIDSLHQTDNLSLVLAMDEGVPLDNISNSVQQLNQEFPSIEMEFLCASSTDVIEMVRTGRATTGVVFSTPHPFAELDFEHLGTVAFNIYVAKSHPLASSVTSNIDELRLHRQLLMHSRQMSTSKSRLAVSPDIWYGDSYYMLLELTIYGFGWSLLPEHIARPAVNNDQLVVIPAQFEQLGRQANIEVIQHKRFSNDPAHFRIRQLLRTLLQGIEA